MDLSRSDSKDSLSAFLKADEDEEENLMKKKSKRAGGGGGGGGGGSRGADAGTRSYDYSGGMLGRNSRGNVGASASYGRGAGRDDDAHYGTGASYSGAGLRYSGANYNPYEIDLDNLPTRQARPQQQDMRASAASSRGAQQPARASQQMRSSKEPPSRASYQDADTRRMSKSHEIERRAMSKSQDVQLKASSGSRERQNVTSRPESSPRRASKKVDADRDSDDYSSDAKDAEDKDTEDSESQVEVQPQESEFARIMREMQELSQAAEETKKKREQEEAEAKRKAEEAKRKAEEEAKAEEERKRRTEEEERQRREEEERKRKEEEERRKREEEERRKKEEEERREKEEEERRKKEEEERRKKEEEARRKKEEEERRKKEEEERRKREEEERERKRKEDEERVRKEREEAEKLRKEKEEKEKRERETEEEARRKKAQEEDGARLRVVREEEERKRRQEEEAARRRAEEDNVRRSVDEETERRRKLEEEDLLRRRREQEEREDREMSAREQENREREAKHKLEEERAHELREQERQRREASVVRELRDEARSVEVGRQAPPTGAGGGCGAEQRAQLAADDECRPEREEESPESREDETEHDDPLAAFRQENVDPDPLAALRRQQADNDPLAALRRQDNDDDPLQQFRARDAAREVALSPKYGDATSDSITLMASVRDSLGPLPTRLKEAGGIGEQKRPPGAEQRSVAPNGASVPREPVGLSQEDLNWLSLRSTESAEEGQRRRFWQAQQHQFGSSTGGARAFGSLGGAGAGCGLEAQSSLLFGSTVCSNAGFAGGRGLAGALGAAETLRPEDLQESLVSGVVQRVDKVKLEALQNEIQGLKRKIILLEEFNQELASAKLRAEALTRQKDEQVLVLQFEGRKLQDGATALAARLRETSIEKHDLEQRLQATERDLADRTADAATKNAATEAKQEEMLAVIASLRAESANLREERDTLRQDLASAPLPCASPGRPTWNTVVASGDESAAVRSLDPGFEAGDSEIVRLRAELEMTEKLLRGCEKENETLAQQNRHLRQLSSVRKEEVDDRHLKLVAELNAARASADTNPASMRRVADLERELVVAKERADELARDLERCREARRQLEREMVTGVPPIATVDANAEQRLTSAEDRCHKAESECAELRERVRKYADSQREMEEDRREVAKLGEEVRELHAENAELKRRPTPKQASRQNTELRKQVDELQECLRKRHPDSLLSLVKACEPKPEERKELRDLRRRVEELEGKLVEREALYDRQVCALRAQYDHIRHEYERRAECRGAGVAKEDGRGGAAAPDREAVLQARIKDLERQVEHTKSYYLSKLRKREPIVPPQRTVGGRPTTAGPRQERSATGMGAQQDAELQRGIRERDARIEELSKALRWQELNTSPAGMLPENSAEATPANIVTSASMMRLFLASPEAQPLIALASELHALACSARGRRFADVASQARSLLAVLCSEEASAAASTAAPEAPAPAEGHDVFKLKMQPPVPCAIWAIWRRQTEQLADIATDASRRVEEAIDAADVCIPAALASAFVALRSCLDGVLGALLQPAGGSGRLEPCAIEAWGLAGGSPVGSIDSVLPRLLLERVREEIDVKGAGHAVGLLHDAEVHAGLDHKLPWSELLGVLERAEVDTPRLRNECRCAASLAWSFPVEELQPMLLGIRSSALAVGAGHSSSPPAIKAPYMGIVKALTRIRLAATRNEPGLPQLFRRLDPEGRGFVTRAEFVEMLRGLRCALSPEERTQLTSYFAPAVDPGWVCYPMFLQSVMPLPGAQTHTQFVDSSRAPARWGNGATVGIAWADEMVPSATATHLDALAKATELEAENSDLRRRLQVVTAKCAESAMLVAQSPVQMVQRLQGEVAMLESRILEQQTTAGAESRKAEITLRAELDVSRHEVAQLRRQLEAKDREVVQYQRELEGIITELVGLRG